MKPLRPLLSLAAALWFALLSFVVLVVFWVEQRLAGDKQEEE